MMQGSLAKRIRVLRAQHGLTLREAAALAGVRPATLSDIEHGRSKPHDVTLAKIAEGYGVPVEELLEEPVPVEKVEASETGPYEDGDLIVAMPYKGAEEGLEVLREAERVAKKRVKHYPDHAVLLDTRVVDGSRIEVYFETPHPIYGPWLEFVDRYAARWEQKIAAGAFDRGAYEEFMETLEDFNPVLVRLGRQEQREQGPDYHFTFGPTINRAISRIHDLFEPMIRAATEKFEENDLARLRRRRQEMERGLKRAAHG